MFLEAKHFIYHLVVLTVALHLDSSLNNTCWILKLSWEPQPRNEIKLLKNESCPNMDNLKPELE